MASGVIVAFHGVQVGGAGSSPAAVRPATNTTRISLAASSAAATQTAKPATSTAHHKAVHHAKKTSSTTVVAAAPKAKASPVPVLGAPTYPAKGVQAPYRDVKLVPNITELATLPGSVPGYKTATSKHKSMTVPASWYGRVSVLPIVAVKGHRIKVRTAQRPNQHETWIKSSSKIYRSSTSYAIVIDLRMRHLFVFKAGRQIGAFPVGVGVARTPTPTGTYFVAFHAPPNPGADYGPVMLETSAHSEVLKTFEGGNDAIVAIHGPITSAANSQIGTHGTRISNGCIRMHDNNLAKFGNKVPDGTPVIITSY
jgi:lipoprotein-anchoring transpeptidase ErfK/SrfK